MILNHLTRNKSFSTMASRLIRQKLIEKSHRYHDGSDDEKLMRHSSFKDRSKRDEASKRHKTDVNNVNGNSKSRHDAAEKNYMSRTKDLKYYRNDIKHVGDREKFVDCRHRPTSLTEEKKFMGTGCSKSRHGTAEKNYMSPTKDLKYYRNDIKHVGNRDKLVDYCHRPTSLTEEIKFMMQYEDHHIIFSKGTTVVEWCPKYIKPELKGHVRGGKALLHHICRSCRRVCLHLLGRPRTPNRQCLGCSGRWEKKHIPKWYYHNDCKYCSRK